MNRKPAILPLSEYFQRAIAIVTGYQPLRPKFLAIESTSHCQLDCEVCGAASGRCARHRGMMDWGLFEHLAAEAARLKPERVCLHAFGEPLLHPRIVDMVELLTRRSLTTELVTNGQLLTPPLARQLRAAGLFELGISHPNVSARNYEVCRGAPPPPGLDNRIAAAVAEWDGYDGQISIRCLTLRRLLSKGAEETAVFLSRWLNAPGISAVVFHGYLPWPKHVCPDLVDFLLAKPRCCPVGIRSLSVLWDGTITACSYDVNAELAIGQAPKDFLKAVYNGPALRALRRKWLRRRHLPVLCRNCLVPRCPTAAAWIGRREWNERMALGEAQKLIWLGKTAKFTLLRNEDIHGDRL